PPRSTLFPYTTLFRSFLFVELNSFIICISFLYANSFVRSPSKISFSKLSQPYFLIAFQKGRLLPSFEVSLYCVPLPDHLNLVLLDRKSTRLNSSHVSI